MRRRKPAGGDDETLNQPLLSEDADGADAPREPSAGADDDASPPFDLLGALHDFFLRLFASLGLCNRTPPPLTEAQKLRLARLVRRVDVPYDAADETHTRQLRELWSLTFPDREGALPSAGASLKHEGWKDMGWQGVDPATDFRSGGVLSLQNLVWFAKHRRETYERLLYKKTGTGSAWEYPFAAAGVNVTFALVDLLELRGSGTRAVPSGAGVVLADARSDATRAPRTNAAVAFLDLLDPGGIRESIESRESFGLSDDARDGRRRVSSVSSADPDFAFEHLYATFWEVFDNEWLDKKASYMEFSSVMESTKDRVRLALERAGKARGGCTLEGVRDALGLDGVVVA